MRQQNADQSRIQALTQEEKECNDEMNRLLEDQTTAQQRIVDVCKIVYYFLIILL